MKNVKLKLGVIALFSLGLGIISCEKEVEESTAHVHTSNSQEDPGVRIETVSVSINGVNHVMELTVTGEADVDLTPIAKLMKLNDDSVLSYAYNSELKSMIVSTDELFLSDLIKKGEFQPTIQSETKNMGKQNCFGGGGTCNDSNIQNIQQKHGSFKKDLHNQYPTGSGVNGKLRKMTKSQREQRKLKTRKNSKSVETFQTFGWEKLGDVAARHDAMIPIANGVDEIFVEGYLEFKLYKNNGVQTGWLTSRNTGVQNYDKIDVRATYVL